MNYELIKPINYGNDGILFLGESDKFPNQLIAIKEFQLSKYSDDYERVVNEIKIHKELKHTNIIPVLDHYVEDHLDYLVMPFIDKSLNDWIYDTSVKDSLKSNTRHIMVQLLSGLAYLHDCGIVHRDIKPDNLLVDIKNNWHLNIADFGQAKKMEDLKHSNNLDFGTLAPELLLGSQEYDTKIDIWAAGCVLGELALQRPLFEGDTELQVVNGIFDALGTPKNADVQLFHSFSHFREESYLERKGSQFDFMKDEELKKCMKYLLNLNYNLRLNANEALEMEWLTC